MRPEVTAKPLHTGRAPTTFAGRAWIGLFRGINVGGRNRLPMKDLAALLAEQGFDEVRTYIQSGNVERLLGVPATARNWRTVTRLLALARGAE